MGPVHLPNELALQRHLKVSRQTPEPVGQGSSPRSAYWWLYNGQKLAMTLWPDYRRVQDEVRLHVAELRAAGTSEADLLRAQELYAGLTTERLDDERLWSPCSACMVRRAWARSGHFRPRGSSAYRKALLRRGSAPSSGSSRSGASTSGAPLGQRPTNFAASTSSSARLLVCARKYWR